MMLAGALFLDADQVELLSRLPALRRLEVAVRESDLGAVEELAARVQEQRGVNVAVEVGECWASRWDRNQFSEVWGAMPPCSEY
jgi:hypothetical protein